MGTETDRTTTPMQDFFDVPSRFATDVTIDQHRLTLVCPRDRHERSSKGPTRLRAAEPMVRVR
jgi:hypothetical protein